jgi:hypothetical protein
MMIDQLSFAYSSPNASIGPSIPVIDNSQPTTENIGVRMYSSLMGTFDFTTPSHHVYAMSSRPVSTGRSIPFRTSYFSDPWTLPSPTSSCEGQLHAGMAMPLSAAEIVYQVVLDSSTILILFPHRRTRRIPFLGPCGPLHCLVHMISSMGLFLQMKLSSKP